MNFIENNKSRIIAILIVFAMVSAFAIYVKRQYEYTENRYDLGEIENGIYARYYQTHSAIPAQNYEVVEICINGDVCSYDGDVFITYASEKPYAVIMENNIVHGDKAYLYVPKGTVDYRESVGIR